MVLQKGELVTEKSFRPLDSINPSSLEHVEADHCVVVEDDRVVRLNETHASHISCEVEHMVDPRGDLQAVIHNPEVHEVELVAEHVLSHMLILLPIGGNDVVTLALESTGNMGPDKASCTSNRDPELLGGPVRLPLKVLIGVLTIHGLPTSASHSTHEKFKIMKRK